MRWPMPATACRAARSPARKIRKSPPIRCWSIPTSAALCWKSAPSTKRAAALAYWAALQSDIAHRSPDEKAREKALDLLALLTPVIKGVLTDRGFDNCVKAQQVFGGHGYIVEWGMEQFVRDARIAMIYEGANGIQALDLVGRKLPANGGRAIMALLGEIGAYIKAHDGDENMKPLLGPLSASLGHLQQSTLWLMQNAMAAPDNAGAAATDYMHLMGVVVLGYMWAQMAQAAFANSDPGRAEFMEAKKACAAFYVQRILPEFGPAPRPHHQRRGQCDEPARRPVLRRGQQTKHRLLFSRKRHDGSFHL